MKETQQEGSTCVKCAISGSDEELEECSVFSSSSLFLLLFLGGALSLSCRASLLQR